MMHMPVRCPACGEKFKDLSKHAGSEKCQLQQNRNAQVTAGRVRVYGYVARHLAVNEPSFGIAYAPTNKRFNKKGIATALWGPAGPIADFCNLIHAATYQKSLSIGKAPTARSLLPTLRRYLTDSAFRDAVHAAVNLGNVRALPELTNAVNGTPT